jgi:hypothetical protein
MIRFIFYLEIDGVHVLTFSCLGRLLVSRFDGLIALDDSFFSGGKISFLSMPIA